MLAPEQWKSEKYEQWSRYLSLFILLKESDFKVIVNQERQLAGLLPKYDPTTLHIQRQAWRDEINKLEKENKL